MLGLAQPVLGQFSGKPLFLIPMTLEEESHLVGGDLEQQAITLGWQNVGSVTSKEITDLPAIKKNRVRKSR